MHDPGNEPDPIDRTAVLGRCVQIMHDDAAIPGERDNEGRLLQRVTGRREPVHQHGAPVQISGLERVKGRHNRVGA